MLVCDYLSLSVNS